MNYDKQISYLTCSIANECSHENNQIEIQILKKLDFQINGAHLHVILVLYALIFTQIFIILIQFKLNNY